MTRICTSCGAAINHEKKFCTECGAPVPPITEPIGTPPPSQPQPSYGGEFVPPKGSKYDPISTGGYIGLSLLLCIPVVGILLAVIWAFGGCKKINKRNYCRAMLIMMVIALIFSFIVGFAVKTLVGKALEEAGIDPKRLTEEGYLESLIPMGDLMDMLGESGLDAESLDELLKAMEGMENLEGIEGLDLEGLDVPTGE